MKIGQIVKPRFAAILAALLFGPSPVSAISFGSPPSGGDDADKAEPAPILENRVEFLDFTYKTPDGLDFNLRDYAKGKQLVIVAYFAGWCATSNRNGHIVERLWKKYRDRGLGVVGVSEYTNRTELLLHVNRIGIDYPVVIETSKRSDRNNSSHSRYRRAVGDKRKWGTPFYVIIERRDISFSDSEELLAARVHTVTGEIIESEAEQFIESRLTPVR